MNKPKHSLRSALADLAEAFAEAVIAAARESLFEFAESTGSAPPRDVSRARPERVRPASPPRAKAPAHVARAHSSPTSASAPVRPAKRPRASRVASDAAHTGPSDQLITDPQLLLAALDTAGPASASFDEAARRKEPEILRPVSTVTPVASVASVTAAAPWGPVLREGEVIVRRSAGGIVLRRRRG